MKKCLKMLFNIYKVVANVIGIVILAFCSLGALLVIYVAITDFIRNKSGKN